MNRSMDRSIEKSPDSGRPDFYRMVGLAGLGLFCYGQYQQELEHSNLILALFGGWMILFPRPRMPAIFLIAASCLQIYIHARSPRTFKLFELDDLPLAAGMLIFMACQFRLIALRWHITPDNPRSAKRPGERPLIPRSREPADITPNELVRLGLLVIASTVFGGIVSHWLGGFWTTLEFTPRFMQLITFLWLSILAVFLASGISGYWRAANNDPERARLLLQEVAWRDSRRDYGRIGRWLAWGKAKSKRQLDAAREASAQAPEQAADRSVR